MLNRDVTANYILISVTHKHTFLHLHITAKFVQIISIVVHIHLPTHTVYTVYGKTFEGENFRGCAQNSLFTGKLSRSQDKTHFPGKLSRSG